MKIIVLLSVIVLSVALAACGASKPAAAPAAPVSTPAPVVKEIPLPETAALPVPQPAPTEGNAYICPMHPEVTSGTPAKCPQCEMDLVTMEEYHKTHPEHAMEKMDADKPMPASHKH